MNQVELLQRCLEGDELAWEVLVRTHQGKVCAIAYTYVGEQNEALDLAQDIFVKIYDRLATCSDLEKFESWMVRLVRNSCLDHLRRMKARPPRQDVNIHELNSLRDKGPTPEDNWLQSTRQKLVHRALQELSVVNREIILLKDIQGLPLDDIATMLDLPLGTVKSRSNRARIELAQAIVGLGGGPDGSSASAEAAS